MPIQLLLGTVQCTFVCILACKERYLSRLDLGVCKKK